MHPLALALLWVLVLVTSMPLARADDEQVQAKAPQDQAFEGQPLPSTESLGLEGSTEAALLLTGTRGLTIIQLGTRSLSSAEDFILVRGLSDELLSLLLQSPSRSWEGSIRVYGGQLTQTDVSSLLASPEAQDLASREFDLFEFYDRLDRLSTLTTKLAYCQAMDLNPPPPPDDALVRDLCQRLQRKADISREAALNEANISNEDDLSTELETSPEETADRKLAELQRQAFVKIQKLQAPPAEKQALWEKVEKGIETVLYSDDEMKAVAALRSRVEGAASVHEEEGVGVGAHKVSDRDVVPPHVFLGVGACRLCIGAPCQRAEVHERTPRALL